LSRNKIGLNYKNKFYHLKSVYQQYAGGKLRCKYLVYVTAIQSFPWIQIDPITHLLVKLACTDKRMEQGPGSVNQILSNASP
jgi:hypothetical protein